MQRRRISLSTALVLLTLVIAAAGVAYAQPLRGDSTSPAVPAAAPLSQSWLQGTTLLTVYGRAFGTAPILGRLGMDRSLDDVARQIEPYRRAVAARTPSHRVVVAIHLIYALATPCSAPTTCLLYLDEMGTDIVRRYIRPAARRGWLVVLDDQLGRSNPVGEMDRLISRGYLRYDNVEIAFDPEFRTVPGSTTPGSPVGSVSAEELNVAQAALSRYASQERLPHRKILMVHQWDRSMIGQRDSLQTDVRGVEPVIVMDAFGAPADKTGTYRRLLDSRTLPSGMQPGIKLFPPSLYAPADTLDTPILTWDQLFGRAPVTADDGHTDYLSPVPRVIVMT